MTCVVSYSTGGYSGENLASRTARFTSAAVTPAYRDVKNSVMTCWFLNICIFSATYTSSASDGVCIVRARRLVVPGCLGVWPLFIGEKRKKTPTIFHRGRGWGGATPERSLTKCQAKMGTSWYDASELHEFRVHLRSASDRALAGMLETLRGVTNLTIERCELRDVAVKALVLGMVSGSWPELHSLTITSCDVDDAAGELIAVACRSATGLRRVELTAVGVGDRTAVELSRVTHLTGVMLSYNTGVTLLARHMVERITGARMTKTALFGNCGHIGPAATFLAFTDSICSLQNEEFLFGDMCLGDEHVDLLVELIRRSARMKRLSVNWNEIGDDGAALLASALKGNSTLEYLSLTGNRIGNRGASALARNLPRSSLRALHLGTNPITDATEILAAIGSDACRVVELNLLKSERDRHVMRMDEDALAAACKRLASLSLISHKGLDVAMLSRCVSASSTMTEINLMDTWLNDADATSVAAMIRACASLEAVSLGRSELTDRGVLALADAVADARDNQRYVRIICADYVDRVSRGARLSLEAARLAPDNDGVCSVRYFQVTSEDIATAAPHIRRAVQRGMLRDLTIRVIGPVKFSDTGTVALRDALARTALKHLYFTIGSCGVVGLDALRTLMRTCPQLWLSPHMYVGEDPGVRLQLGVMLLASRATLALLGREKAKTKVSIRDLIEVDGDHAIWTRVSTYLAHAES